MVAITPRSAKLDLRLTADTKRVLQTAARASKRSVSEFIIESALARAEETLPDRQRFGLDLDAWTAFHAALDAPVRPLPRITCLMREPSPFETAGSARPE